MGLLNNFEGSRQITREPGSIIRDRIARVASLEVMI